MLFSWIDGTEANMAAPNRSCETSIAAFSINCQSPPSNSAQKAENEYYGGCSYLS